MKFPDQGTTIGDGHRAGRRSCSSAFDFLERVRQPDGALQRRTGHPGDDRRARRCDEILGQARRANIPVYLIRTSYNKGLGAVVPDDIWKPAVEATGGRFYAAADEAAVLPPSREIDRLSAGAVAIKQYSTQQPRFSASP